MSNPIAGKKILICGGAGFIGHHMALALHRLGARVEVIDSLQVNNLNAFASDVNNIPNRNLYLKLIHERLERLYEADIPLHVVDIRDYQLTSRVFGSVKPDAVVHLSAVAHANVANKDPYTTFDHSLRTLENTLDCARYENSHFIYFSSSMVYGNFLDGMVTEASPCEPIGIYGALKFAGEKMVIAYNQVFNLPYTIVRPSALYGERCVSRRVGQVFIENALQGLELQVAGDGSDQLDFTYVEDVVNGVIAILSNDKSRGQVFNMTYGSSRSISDMVEILRAHVPGIVVKETPRDRLMPARGTLSMDKAKDLLGFTPQFSIDKGFPRYIQWYKDLFKSNSLKLARTG
jgi:nucleoside-diphosphate-sugar epimerase